MRIFSEVRDPISCLDYNQQEGIGHAITEKGILFEIKNKF